MTALLLVLVGEISLCGGHEGGELLVVLASDILEGENRSSLLMDDGSEASLGFNDHVRDAHLAAKCRQEDHELDRVNIVGNHNKVRLLRFNKRNGVVQAVLDEQRLLGVLILSLLVLGSGLRDSVKARLLLLLGLGAVFVKELEKLGRGVLVEGVLELRDRGRDLKALVEDNLLALEAHILGPLDEASKIGLVLNVLANTEVTGSSLEERVLGRRLGLAARPKWRRGGLLSGLGLRGLVIERDARLAIVLRFKNSNTTPVLNLGSSSATSRRRVAQRGPTSSPKLSGLEYEYSLLHRRQFCSLLYYPPNFFRASEALCRAPCTC